MSESSNDFATECIFCKIVEGSIPSAKVYEDESFLAFLDINPVAQGHTLVIPKKHYATILDFPEGLGNQLITCIKKVALAVQDYTGATGFNCLQNNFSVAGQVVFHSHWHIVPRYEADGLRHWPTTTYADIGAMNHFATSIREHIG